MAIAFYAEDIELPAINKQAVSGWVRAVAATYGKKTGDISYIFCSDERFWKSIASICNTIIIRISSRSIIRAAIRSPATCLSVSTR